MQCSRLVDSRGKRYCRKTTSKKYYHKTFLPKDPLSIIASYLDRDDRKYLDSLPDDVLQRAAKSKVGNIQLDREEALSILEASEDIDFSWAINKEILPLIKHLAPFQDDETILDAINNDVTDNTDILRYLLPLVKADEQHLLKKFMKEGTDYKLVRFFLEERKVKPFEGILSMALSDGNINKYNIVKLLLDYGVDPNKDYIEYGNVLEIAADTGDIRILELLISEGINLGKFGQEALRAAISSKNIEIVEYLLDLDVLPTKYMVDSAKNEEIQNLLRAKLPLRNV